MVLQQEQISEILFKDREQHIPRKDRPFHAKTSASQSGFEWGIQGHGQMGRKASLERSRVIVSVKVNQDGSA